MGGDVGVGWGCAVTGQPTPGNTGRCNLCDEPVPSMELLDHLRVLHPDAYGDGPERWPDGGVVVHEELDPGEFAGGAA